MYKKMVSIWCITYNQVEYIRDALEGFLKQKTNFSYEVFVYDDASTDGTSEVLLEYQKNYPDIFRLYISDRNRWKDKDRRDFLYKLKVDNLDAKYIAMCEGDDYWTDENKLQVQVDYMESHPECSMYIHNSLWLDCTTNTINAANTFDIADEGDINVDDIIIQKKLHPATASFMFKRELYDSPIFFFKASVSDYPLLLCAAANGKIHYNSKAMSVYRFKSNGSYNSMLVSKFEMQTYYYLGLIDFLICYNNYTKSKYKSSVYIKLLSVVNCYIRACTRHEMDVKTSYKMCLNEGYDIEHISNELLDKLNSLYLSETSQYISDEVKIFVSKYKNIVVMGTGVYSDILTQKLLNSNVDFAGYAKTSVDSEEKHNGKSVWKLSEIPYEKSCVGILVGILIIDKNDIINSLKNSHIDNYLMPFDYEESIMELLKL